MGSGPESFHLITHQVGIVLGPQQLQRELQLREVRQDRGQCQPGPH
jgi:hypothetical protein